MHGYQCQYEWVGEKERLTRNAENQVEWILMLVCTRAR